MTIRVWAGVDPGAFSHVVGRFGSRARQCGDNPDLPAYLDEMDEETPRAKSGPAWGTVALVGALFGILLASIWFAARAWTAVEGPPMPATGYIAMALGVVLSLAVGIALMTLLFYSSRHGYDEQVHDRSQHHDERD